MPHEEPSSASYESWVGDRKVHWGTNHGVQEVAFQRWQPFKEAYPPEVVERAIRESRRNIRSVLDPFGGSGTTALTAQFLGVRPVTIELNPYLADVIESKLVHYDLESLTIDIQSFIDRAVLLESSTLTDSELPFLPDTFVEPGRSDRWIFSDDLAHFLLAAIAEADGFSAETRRLIRCVIGGALVALSNVRINGKGRRYRGGWETRQKTPKDALVLLRTRFAAVLGDLRLFNERLTNEYELLRGDARSELSKVEMADLAVFSPPYPNSFDYTDVYNLELWMLGYLSSMADNRSLRSSTLASHVQISRDFAKSPPGSTTLNAALDKLSSKRTELWSPHLPDMIGAYFAEMVDIVSVLQTKLHPEGEAWIVVGDSQYAGVTIPVAEILRQLAVSSGWDVVHHDAFRSMRTSPQQGGAESLPESLLVLRRS